MGPLANEPLFLDHNGHNVEISPLFAQHLRPFQRNGIRFLYHAYIDKQPGIILNDSSGHGKTIQTALFVEVVLKTFHTPPALILCDVENVQHWKYVFQIWTNFAKDVLDETTNNIFSRNQIFVNTTQNVQEMSRREWGVVVVDSADAVKLLKLFQGIKTGFKIWITNENLFGDLKSLHLIHRWLDPAAPCLDKYAVSPTSLAAQVHARIELDRIFYYVLLRRTDRRVGFDAQVHDELYETWKTNQTINRQAYFNASSDKSTHSPRHSLNIPENQDKNVEVSTRNKKHKTNDNKTDTGRKKIKTDSPDKGSSFSAVTACQIELDLANIQRCTEQCLPLIHNEESRNMNVPVNKQPNNSNVEQENTSNNDYSICETSSNKINVEVMNESGDRKKSPDNIEQTHTQMQPNAQESNTCENYIHNSKTTAVADIIKKKESFSEEANTQRYEYTNNKIQSSMKKVEEMANKQFKGSLLDSLF